MRLILAALVAAVLGFGGALLFSNYFGSIEIEPTEQEPKIRVDRDTPTRPIEERAAAPYDPVMLSYISCLEYHGERIGLPEGARFEDQVQLVRSRLDAPSKLTEDTLPHYVAGQYDIEANGIVSNIEIIHFSPTNLWNQSVIDLLGKWKFKPATVDGVKVKLHGCPFSLSIDWNKKE